MFSDTSSDIRMSLEMENPRFYRAISKDFALLFAI